MVCGMIKHKKQKKLTRANFQLKKNAGIILSEGVFRASLIVLV